MKALLSFFLILFITAGCGNQKNQVITSLQDTTFQKGSFGYDLNFIRKHKEVIILGEGFSKVLIVRDFQARIMTSTAHGLEGKSYGWVNHGLIESGAHPQHIIPYGGEDRFWMGPEGGQYSLFFKKGTSFDFGNWQTPPFMDSEGFDLISQTSMRAIFKKSVTVTNYAGFVFQFDIHRAVRLLETPEIKKEFGIDTGDLGAVAFESNNLITNTGEDWKKKTGLLSIWILGMFIPSEQTTIVIPHEKSERNDPGITDNYFGTIPPERLIKTEKYLMLKGDGRFRGKVGVAPALAKNMAGSYDAKQHVLTLIKFDLEKNADYVNSKWEIQREPYRGDIINAYNDGPLPDGSQLGPFYELESSSLARELRRNETLAHRHLTLHLEGNESALNEVAKKTLGISLKEITTAFVSR